MVARRQGGVWYVGGLNGRNDAATAHVPLAFLGSGSWTTLIRDGATDRTFDNETRGVKRGEVVDVPMRGMGGFVMRLTAGR